MRIIAVQLSPWGAVARAKVCQRSDRKSSHTLIARVWLTAKLELTRVGMGTREMAQVADFYARVLVKHEAPAKVKADVKAFKARFQAVQYCFNPEDLGGYEYYEIAQKQPSLAKFA